MFNCPSVGIESKFVHIGSIYTGTSVKKESKLTQEEINPYRAKRHLLAVIVNSYG